MKIFNKNLKDYEKEPEVREAVDNIEVDGMYRIISFKNNFKHWNKVLSLGAVIGGSNNGADILRAFQDEDNHALLTEIDHDPVLMNIDGVLYETPKKIEQSYSISEIFRTQGVLLNYSVGTIEKIDKNKFLEWSHEDGERSGGRGRHTFDIIIENREIIFVGEKLDDYDQRILREVEYIG